MPNRFDSLKSFGDYMRDEEEFQMRKQAAEQSMELQRAKAEQARQPGGGFKRPDAMVVFDELKRLEAEKNYEDANRLNQLYRPQTFGVDQYGAPVGTPPLVAREGEAPQEGFDVPEGVTPYVPQASPGIADILAQKAGLKERYKTQAKQDVRGDTEADIQRDISGAKLGQELEYRPQIKQAEVEAKDRATKTIELREREAMIPELEDTLADLDKFAKLATYTLAGQAYDAGRTQLGFDPSEGAVARTEYDTTISNVILPLLRQTFGAAFTAKEGDSLRATLGDINATPEQKQAAIRSFIAQRKRDIKSRKRELGVTDQYQQDEAAFNNRKSGRANSGYKNKYGLE